MTVNSVVTISLAPPSILVALTSGSRTANMVKTEGSFAVSFLSEGQLLEAEEFSRNGADRVPQLTRVKAIKNPVVSGAAAFLECDVSLTRTVADHVIVIGEVVHVTDDGLPPLRLWATTAR